MDVRPSLYTIVVDLPDTPQRGLLFHGLTGAADEVSSTVLRALAEDRAERCGSLLESLSGRTSQILRERGYLTARTETQEIATLIALAQELRKRSEIPSFMILTSLTCNLGCAYCYQHGESPANPGRGHGRVFLDLETSDLILEAIARLSQQFSPALPRIGLFGGEPLLRRTAPVVRHIVRRARALGFGGISAVSNGTEWEYHVDSLGPDAISWIQVTIDGSPPVHNGRRPYRNGRPSLDQISKNVALALERGVHILLRVNIDNGNVDDLPQLNAYIQNQGWADSSHFTAEVALVRDNVTDLRPQVTMDMIRKIDEQFSHSGDWLIAPPDHRLIVDLENLFRGGPLPLSVIACGAQSGSYLFGPEREIYSCWEDVADPGRRVGVVSPDGRAEFFENDISPWRQRAVTSIQECLTCPYVLYCGGGCGARARARARMHSQNSDWSTTPACDDFPQRFSRAAGTAYRNVLQSRTRQQSRARQL